MPLESLLVSRDPQVIRVLRPALEKLAIEVEICRGADSGSEILSCEKFDAVIVAATTCTVAWECSKPCAGLPATGTPSHSQFRMDTPLPGKLFRWALIVYCRNRSQR